MRKIVIAALLLAPTVAWAEPKTASDWYAEGENQYNLGAFDKAVEDFKKGFELENVESKKAAYLFNIAQSYRQANDCKNAHFFYKRFLAVADADPNKPVPAKTRKQVQDRIAELEQCANQAVSISKKPPNSLKGGEDEKPADDPTGTQPAATPSHKPADKTVAQGDEPPHDEGEPEAHAQLAGAPHIIDARVTAGGDVLSMGKISVPTQVAFALIIGYPIAINDKLTIDAGAALTLSPVPWSTTGAMQMSGTGLFTGVMADGAATYAVTPKIGVRFDAGVGVLLFSGISNSPFTGEQPTSGALTMLHLRGALSGEYAVTPNFIVTLPSLALGWSPPKSGLVDTIKSIVEFDFMAGVAYRM